MSVSPATNPRMLAGQCLCPTVRYAVRDELSVLYSVVCDGKYVHVTPGTLVDTPGISPTAHIFIGSKARRFAIADDLPQHTTSSVETRSR